jgi:hypothetical protein
VEPTRVPPRPTNTPVRVNPFTPTSPPAATSPPNETPTEAPCFCTDTPPPPTGSAQP